MLVQKQKGKESQSNKKGHGKIWLKHQQEEIQKSENNYTFDSFNSNYQTNYPFFGERSPTFFSGIPVQAKLIVGKPNDKYEREADAMADRVMRMPMVSSRGKLSSPILKDIQANCKSCEQEEDQINMKPLMMKSEGGRQEAAPGLASQLNASKRMGRPLPGPTNRFMSNAFSTDFGQVRVHTEDSAIQMNKELGAQAFTHGSDIYFNKGQYNPISAFGKRLLAHELTHVMQQQGIQTKSSSEPIVPITNLILRQKNEEGEYPWSENKRKAVRNQINHQLGVFYSNFGDAAVGLKVKSAIAELKEKQSISLELLFDVAAGFLTAGLSKFVIKGIKRGYKLLAKKSIIAAEHFVKLSENKDSAEKLLHVYAGISEPALNQAKSSVKSQFSSIGSNKAVETYIDTLLLGTNMYTFNIAGQVPSLTDDKLKSLLFALVPENVQLGRFTEEIEQQIQKFKKYVFPIGTYRKRKLGYLLDPFRFGEKAIWVESRKNRRVLAYVQTNVKGYIHPGSIYPQSTYYDFKRWIPPSVSDLAIATTEDWFGSIETVSVDQVTSLSTAARFMLKYAPKESYHTWLKLVMR